MIAESAERPDPALDDERRRYYRLTDFGREVARAEAARMETALGMARAKKLIPKGEAGVTSDRWYRRLLRLLPFDFRADYGDEMARVFRDQRRDAAGAAGAVRVWLETVGDALPSVRASTPHR